MLLEPKNIFLTIFAHFCSSADWIANANFIELPYDSEYFGCCGRRSGGKRLPLAELLASVTGDKPVVVLRWFRWRAFFRFRLLLWICLAALRLALLLRWLLWRHRKFLLGSVRLLCFFLRLAFAADSQLFLRLRWKARILFRGRTFLWRQFTLFQVWFWEFCAWLSGKTASGR